MKLYQLNPGQLFRITDETASLDIYRFDRKWLDDGMPWQYQFYNLNTRQWHITKGDENVRLVTEFAYLP